MKKLIMLLMATVGCTLTALANDDNCEVSLVVEVQEQDGGLPVDMNEQLAARLRQAVIQNGIAGTDQVSNFNLVASTYEASKEILSGMRPMVAVTYDLRMYVTNVLTGEKFKATTLTLKGAGRNEMMASRAAVASLRNQNRAIQLFLQDAHRRILAFYDNQAPLIIKQAKADADMQDFEHAMFLLQTIPACSKQYDKAEKAMKEVFQQFIDRDCAGKIAKARNIWNATQNKEGALLAGAYLAAINPNSACTNDAQKLEKAISERIGEQWEFAKEMMRDSVKMEEKYIEALKVIGKAYGKNQGDTTINVVNDGGASQPEARPDEDENKIDETAKEE